MQSVITLDMGHMHRTGYAYGYAAMPITMAMPLCRYVAMPMAMPMPMTRARA